MAPKPSKDSAIAVQQRFTQGPDSFGDFSVGMKVGIVGEAGVFKIKRFGSDSGGDFVTVVGGPVWGQEQTMEFRSFSADRLTTKIIKRARKSAPEQEEE